MCYQTFIVLFHIYCLSKATYDILLTRVLFQYVSFDYISSIMICIIVSHNVPQLGGWIVIANLTLYTFFRIEFEF